MGKAVGYFLVLAGVSSGAYAIMPDTKLADIATTVSSSVMSSAPQAVLAVRTEAAATGLQSGKQSPNQAQGLVPPAPQLAVRPGTAAAGMQVAQAVVPSAPALVQKSAEPIEVVPKAVVASKGKASGAEDDARAHLARDIQRELKRVGCYSGDVNGEWTSGSRAAMNQFIERINATLPTDQPDHILKTLVQGHPGNACGKTCPAGQGLSNEGRCQPSAILAQQAAPRRQVTRSAAATRDADERPAVALAPKPRLAAPAGWETKVVTATPSPVAPVAVGPAAVALAPRADTPAGRMAVGGPADGAADRDAGSLSAVNPIVTGSAPAVKLAVPRVAAIPSPNVERDGDAIADDRRPQRIEADRRPVPPQNVYAVPRPRYVAAPQYYYPPQQVYRAPARERTAFGPRIFTQMQRDGR